MHKLFLPLAMACAISLAGTTSQAIEDDYPDDVLIDDFDDVPHDDASPAVPEPTAALAMGAGLATIAFALRRRR
jgi:hypothetical protein